MPKKVNKFKTNIKVWHMFLHPFFKGFFKNIVFRSVALVIKKFWAILDFFTHSGRFNAPCAICQAATSQGLG